MKCCTNCAHGAWLNSDEPITEICTGCEYICGEPSMWKKQNTTNADRIRAMTDEELAAYLVDIGFDCHLCSEHRRLDNEPLLRNEKCDEKCEKHCLDWLKQPEEGDA